MRVDTFRPPVGVYPQDPLSKQPMQGGFATEMEGRHYDIFEHSGSAWVFATSKRNDQGGIGAVAGCRFSAYGFTTVSGAQAAGILAELIAKYDAKPEAKPAAKTKAA